MPVAGEIVMPRINGGKMLVRALEREGVYEIVTLHGGHLDAGCAGPNRLPRWYRSDRG